MKPYEFAAGFGLLTCEATCFSEHDGRKPTCKVYAPSVPFIQVAVDRVVLENLEVEPQRPPGRLQLQVRWEGQSRQRRACRRVGAVARWHGDAHDRRPATTQCTVQGRAGVHRQCPHALRGCRLLILPCR